MKYGKSNRAVCMSGLFRVIGLAILFSHAASKMTPGYESSPSHLRFMQTLTLDFGRNLTYRVILLTHLLSLYDSSKPNHHL